MARPAMNPTEAKVKKTCASRETLNAPERKDATGQMELDAATLAGYQHVESMVKYADVWSGAAPMWHGWALREAFIAGTKWEAPSVPNGSEVITPLGIQESSELLLYKETLQRLKGYLAGQRNVRHLKYINLIKKALGDTGGQP